MSDHDNEHTTNVDDNHTTMNDDDSKHQDYHPAVCNGDSDDEACDEEHNYDSNYSGNDTEGHLDVPEDEATQNNDVYNFLLNSGFFPFISTGPGERFGFVIPFINNFRNAILGFFDRLPEYWQMRLGHSNPAHSCIVFRTDEVVAQRGGNFTVGDIEGLPAAELIKAMATGGLTPVGKTLTKRNGPSSLEEMIGGDRTKYSSVNELTATLLRSGVFTAIVTPDQHTWDGIILAEDADERLAAARAEASNRYRKNFPFSVREKETGVLLMKVMGRGALSKILPMKEETLHDVVNKIYTLADDGVFGRSGSVDIRKWKKDNNGNDIYRFTIEGTPEDCNEEPVDDAASRWREGNRLCDDYSRSSRGGGADIYFLIYSNNDDGNPGVLEGRAKGLNSVSREMGTKKHWRTSVSESTILRHESDNRMLANTKSLWEEHEYLYNGYAGKWVRKVDIGEYNDNAGLDQSEWEAAFSQLDPTAQQALVAAMQ